MAPQDLEGRGVTPVGSPPGHGRNPYLQWLRAAAAGAVVLFHASVYLQQFTGDERFAAVFGRTFGVMGVALFFAISGALMADIVRRTEPKLFLAHRLARIYPLFALVFLTVSVLQAGTLHGDVRALSLGLVGRRAEYVLGIEWTLVIEIFFYVLLYALAALRLTRRLDAFAALWLAAIIAAAALGGTTGTQFPTLLQVLLLPVNAAFAGGLLVPALLARTGFPKALLALAFACMAASLPLGLDAARILCAVAAVAITGMAVAHAPGQASAQTLAHASAGPQRSVPGRALERLGDWSYGLYLCHVPIILMVYRLMPGPPALLWSLAVGASILVSIPLGMLDVALYRRLRQRVNGLRRPVLALSIHAYVLAYAAIAVIFLFKQR